MAGGIALTQDHPLRRHVDVEQWLEPGQEVSGGEYHLGAAIGQNMVQLIRGKHRVDRDGDGTHCLDRQIDDGKGRDIRQEERNSIAWVNLQRGQALGATLDQSLELRVGE
jgi:hypothetical protein